MRINLLDKNTKTETYVYLGLWSLAFLAPLLNMYFSTVASPGETFDGEELLRAWRQEGLFLLLFLLHNYLLAPLLVYAQRKGLYLTCVSAVVVAFVAMECTCRPEPPGPAHDKGGPPLELADKRPQPLQHPGHRPPSLVGEREVTEALLLILMAGMNIGVKLYFKSLRDRNELELVERRGLELQLEHLKYQINPHFFMNTLNNIHALIDIDPEKAKQSVVELSRMMRYVLYEGNQQLVPLQKEFDFVRHYVALMKLRYTDEVSIALALPCGEAEGKVPPLLLVTFIENAFKHGVSYSHASHVKVEASVAGGRLRFECRNSKSAQPNTERRQGGVGLENVRRRLALIYGESHELLIDDGPAEYVVRLSLPV